MEPFFGDPNVERLPPADVRLADLQASPSDDGNKVRVTLEITPFLQRPYLELVLADASGQELASASIIEPMAWKLELTLHIRKPATDAGEQSASSSDSCTLTAILAYPDLGEIDRRQVTLNCKPTS